MPTDPDIDAADNDIDADAADAAEKAGADGTDADADDAPDAAGDGASPQIVQ